MASIVGNIDHDDIIDIAVTSKHPIAMRILGRVKRFLEHFPIKWSPLDRQKMRPGKKTLGQRLQMGDG
jgi:hypothetical protein